VELLGGEPARPCTQKLFVVKCTAHTHWLCVEVTLSIALASSHNFRGQFNSFLETFSLRLSQQRGRKQSAGTGLGVHLGAWAVEVRANGHRTIVFIRRRGQRPYAFSWIHGPAARTQDIMREVQGELSTKSFLSCRKKDVTVVFLFINW